MNNSAETRLLVRALRDPVLLKKRLVLAIALAPPKSQARTRGSRRRRLGRR